MNKLKLIVMREYLTRIKNKTFLLATLLAPLGMLLYFGVIALVFSYKSDDIKKILVVDKSAAFDHVLVDNNLVDFEYSSKSVNELRAEFDSLKMDGILFLPVPNIKSKDYTVFYYSEEPLDMAGSVVLQSALKKGLRKHKIKALELDPSILDQLSSSISIDPEPIREGQKDSSIMAVGIATGIGTIIGFIMFFVVMIYGMMVMRSVMEEKVNRIVEVIMSSVRPIELMLGKIIGVGLVGLTQLGIWLLTIPLIFFLVRYFFGPSTGSSSLIDNMSGAQASDPEEITNTVFEAMQVMSDINWWYVLPMILLFFVGGYLLYSSLYAAVGSAIGEDMGEAQALTLPISIPLILAFYIMFVAVQSPNSTLAVVSSIFPFFSPIVMPARLMFHPPAWQIALSVLLLLMTIYFMVWLSAKIYRVGILMYGKKASFKEIAKWVVTKD